MNEEASIPKPREMFKVTMEALGELGGTGTIQEIDEGVSRLLKLTEKQISFPHSEVGTRTRLSYNLAWTRTYLQVAGLLDNRTRGVWVLTSTGYKKKHLGNQKIYGLYVHARRIDNPISATDSDPSNNEPDWRDQLIQEILNTSPSGFERLCQRILKESGFIDVEVLGRSGDGGIDGKGTLRVNGWLRFVCCFQCKKYKGSVQANEVRDFRGAISGRSDKGIFITTGSFTKGAKEEASRDGVAPLDLIDGERLTEKMKELELGVRVKKIESITVQPEVFAQFKD